jgi:Domain of unknown function (DUF4192)
MTVPADSPTTPSARLRASTPSALLAVIPHLLGFQPESSLVIIGIEQPGGKVKITLRYDLPDPADASQAEDVGEHAAAVLQSQRIPAAVAVGYGPDRLVRPVASAFAEAALDAGIELRESLRADEGRYWSCTCRDETCCPAEGTPTGTNGHPLPDTPADSGEPVLTSRAALAQSLAPLGGLAAESMREAATRAEQHVTKIVTKLGGSSRPGAAKRAIAAEGLAAVSEMIALYRGGGTFSTDYQLAWLTVVLKDLRVRDDAWSRMDPEHAPAHLRLWTDVVRRAQPGHGAPAASLLAFTAWQSGNGALANVALDRALADDPGYSMAQLLRQVITAGAPPSMARLPMTPEEVADSYDRADQEKQGTSASEDRQPAGVTP